MKKVWAFDIGASNGRLMLSGFDGKRFRLEEIYRFPNHPIQITNHYYWDILKIFDEMKTAMAKSIRQGHKQIESFGVDTWGVDFGLLSRSGELLGNPYSYRDPQAAASMDHALKLVPAENLFAQSGVEAAPINTLFQLYALKERRPELLDDADTLLMMPNLITYLFSGEKVNEFTISTTTQMLSLEDQNWNFGLLGQLGLPSGMLAPVAKPAAILGGTLPDINSELMMEPVRSVNVAGHDTASALAALPIQDDNAVFMSCGTWVLMGMQVTQPVVSKEAQDWGFTNEGTLDGEYRLLKNNMGLWLIQQCRSIWEKEGIATDYEEENRLIREGPPFQSFINPDDPVFFNPDNMVKTIQDYCRNTGQPVPVTRPELLSCILESLALKYRWVIECLEKLTGKRLDKIHMGGGGIRNQWLCQFTADATGREVIAGPVEISAIGNSIAQWIALGEIKDLREARRIVAASFPQVTYQPKEERKWQEVYQRFTELV